MKEEEEKVCFPDMEADFWAATLYKAALREVTLRGWAPGE